MRKKATKYFEEELSGEPLYQDMVIDWLVDFTEMQFRDVLNWLKSELQFETEPKMDKYPNQGKVDFIKQIIKKLEA